MAIIFASLGLKEPKEIARIATCIISDVIEATSEQPTVWVEVHIALVSHCRLQALFSSWKTFGDNAPGSIFLNSTLGSLGSPAIS